MVAIRDRDTEGGSHDSGPLGPGSRPIDNAPETPTDGTPTAAQNQTIPIIYGTARITPRIVYQKPPETIKAFKDWTAADGYAQRDGTGAPTILAIGETPISSIVGWWREGSTKNFPAGTLKYLGGAYQRKVASGGGSSTTVVIPGTALPGTILGMPENATVQFTSGTNSGQMRTVASWTATSITLSSALPGTPSMDDSFFVTAGYRVQTADDPGTPIAWLGTWNGASYTGDAVGMGFKGTAYFASPVLALGENGKVPKIQFEVAGKCIDATSTIHANPADVVVDILTSSRYGVGLDAAQVEVEYGPDGLAASSYRRYCDQAGLLVSRAIEGQESAAELLSSLMFCTNSVLVCTQGKVKIIPRCDVAVGTYAPPSTAAVLDENEIVREGTDDFLTIRRTPESEVFNRFPITIEDREADYESAELAYEDTAHSQQYGQRTASTSRADWITQKAIAQQLSSVLAQRSIYVRNRYRFRVKPRWALLEPMDVISVSSPSMEISNVRCRIMNLRRLTNGLIEIDADEAPDSVALPVDLTPQPHDGYDSVAPAPVYISDQTPGSGSTTTIGASAPASPAIGDMWVDSANSYQTYVWNGSAWVLITSSGSKVYAQASEPFGGTYAEGDIWIDTDDGNKIYVRIGGAWVLKRDQGAVDGSAALTLAGTKTAAFYQAAAPSNPQDGYTLRTGDLWFNTDLLNVCPDTNCKGHAADAAGDPLVGSYAHRGLYWNHRWNGSAWVSAETQALVIASEIAAGAVVADKIGSHAVTTDKLTVGNFDNLVPNPTCAITDAPASTPEGAGVFYYPGAFSPNGYYRRIVSAGASGSQLLVTGLIPASAGEQYYFEARGVFGVTRLNAVFIAITARDSAGSAVLSSSSPYLANVWPSGDVVNCSITCPSGTAYVQAELFYEGGKGTAGDAAYFSNLYLRRKADASMIVQGSLVVTSGQVTGLGDLATQNSVSTGQVTGLGALATQNSIDYSGSQITNKPALGSIAYLNEVANANITSIDGGKITTGYIDAAHINAIDVSASNLTIGGVVFANMVRKYELTISGTSSQASVTFGTAEPDTNFVVMVTAGGAYNSPPANSFILGAVNKSVNGFTIFTQSAPGSGNSTFWNAIVFRLP